MNFQEAKATLIEAWGNLGSSWGINKTMAQIHVLLMISPKPLCTEDVMAELNISRGNANMNIRALLDWRVIYRKHIPGDRKEYFYPEKDIWELARIVARERRKRELEPAIRVLKQIRTIPQDDSAEVKEFMKVTGDLVDFSEQADEMLEKMSRAEQTRLMKMFLAMA